MGAANVGAVLLTWHDVSHRAHRVLVAMAHMSLDEARPGAPARRYWDGPGYLAEVLYGPDGIEGRDGKGRAIPTPSARRQVEKCLTELVRVGAVRRVVKGSHGRRSEYEVVTFRPVDSPTETVGASPTETVGVARPERSAQPDRNGRAQEDQENQEHREDDIQLSAPQDRATGRPVDNEHRIESTGQVWHDVPLIPDVPATALQGITDPGAYGSAHAHLERTIGRERAGEAVARLIAIGYASYTEAVIGAALDTGWKP